MSTLKEKITELENKVNSFNADNSKGWFEKNQGLITFCSYLATVLIGGISLYNSTLLSKKTLKDNYRQFKYTLHKDSVDRINQNEQWKEQSSFTIKQYKLQDSTYKKQLNLTKKEVSVFLGQLETYRKQLVVIQKEKDLIASKIKQADYADRAILISQDIKIDSLNGKNNEILVAFSNRGNHNCIIKKYYVYAYNFISDSLRWQATDNVENVATINSSYYTNIYIDKINYPIETCWYYSKIYYYDETNREMYHSEIFFKIDLKAAVQGIYLNKVEQITFRKLITQRLLDFGK